MRTLLQSWVIDGGFMMIFLVPTAVLTLAYAVQGLVNLRRSRIAPPELATAVRQAMMAGGRNAAVEALRKSPTSLALVVLNSLRHLDIRPDADPVEVLREEIEGECTLLEEHNSQLSLMYTIAPLMGLLGTVFGMLSAFREFTALADPSVQQLSQGIQIAFITTAWGLAIAIPAYTVLFYMQRKISAYETTALPTQGSELLKTILEPASIPQAE